MDKMMEVQRILGTKCSCGHIFNINDLTLELPSNIEYFKCIKCGKEIAIGENYG